MSIGFHFVGPAPQVQSYRRHNSTSHWAHFDRLLALQGPAWTMIVPRPDTTALACRIAVPAPRRLAGFLRRCPTPGRSLQVEGRQFPQILLGQPGHLCRQGIYGLGVS